MKKHILFYGLLTVGIALLLVSCGVYSFTGAKIEGKSINIETLDNTSANVVPTLSSNLSEKIRNRILSQTGLTPLKTEPDYEISGTITGYNVSVSGVGDAQTSQASLNRLSITVSIEFKNKLNAKENFKQTFSRFADFSASQQLTTVETKLIEEIGDQLADDIFNKAFVNW